MTELDLLSPEDVLRARRAEIEALWRRVFPDTSKQRFEEILPRHAARTAFTFVAAHAEDGTLGGFAYGYEGRRGEWWHDLVASALTPEQEADWLAPGHFEFVELQVAPELEGQGLGSRLHDALLARARGSTAVLSTEASNERARGFYARRGWELLLDEIDFGEGYRPFVVLGKRLH